MNPKNKIIMKPLHLYISTSILLAAAAIPSHAGSMTWVNIGGGSWSDTNNWSSLQIPGPGDTVFITNAGNYSVALDISPTVAALVLGAGHGGTTQSFFTDAQTLTINGPIEVNSNGQFNFNGGTLTGTIELLQGGTLTWSGGAMSGALVVNSFAVLNLQDGGGDSFNSVVLTNYGTVNWTNATLYGFGGNNAQIYNFGLWNEQGNDSFVGGYNGGTSLFENFGTFQKSTNTGVSTLDPNVMFNNNGTVLAESGTLNLYGGTNSYDSFLTGTDATINLNNFTFTNTTTCTGPGTYVTGETLMAGTNVGTLNWNGGSLSGILTIASNSVLNIVAGGGSGFNGLVLTNLGTVNWTNTDLYSVNGNNAQIYNYGIWNAQSDNSFQGGYNGGVTLFENFGTFLKSAGNTTTTTIDGNVIFNNFGTANIETGTLDLAAGSSSGGVFTTASGAIVDFVGYTFTNSTTFNGIGSFVAGNAIFGGTIIGTLSWDGGYLAGNMVIATNGVFNIVTGGGSSLNGLTLINHGTVNWTNTDIYGVNGFNAQIYNYGLWNAQSDNTFQGGYNGGVTLFDNFGTFRKSGHTGLTTLDGNVVFNNTGAVNVLNGTLSINGGTNSASGTFTTANGGLLVLNNMDFANSATISGNGAVSLGGNTTINGLLTAQDMQLVGGTLGGTNVLMGTLTWSGGTISANMTIASNSVLNIVSGLGVDVEGLVLTNLGTVNWTNTDIYGINGNNAQIYNYGVWNAQSDNDFQGGYNGGVTLFDNFGTFRKSGSTGDTILDGNVVFNNTGTLDSQYGNISLQGAYNLTNGTLNFGISGLTNYGTITLSGAASLTGAISANLNNGYQPVGGNSFTNLYYDSYTGGFTNAVLPSLDAWSTNYDSTSFVLEALNARPIFVASASNLYVVDELTALTVTNTATDLESPPQTLTYSLTAGPSGIVVNPVTGLLTWTPPQTNSPSTNTIVVSVLNNGTPPLSATLTYTIVVVEVNVAPILPSSSVKTITVQEPFSITNSATEPNIHSATAGYMLLAPPAGAAINSNGVITWTPAQNQSLTTNTIRTVVTNTNPFDAVNPHLSSTNTIVVTVLPNAAATNLVALRSAGNNLTLSWPADHAGWRLELQTNSLSGTWATFPGSSATNLEIIPIALTNSVFFRMIYP